MLSISHTPKRGVCEEYARGNVMEHKFKVGDKVIGNKRANNAYALTRQGFIGTVIGYIEKSLVIQDEEYSIKYYVNEQCFDLIVENEEVIETAVEIIKEVREIKYIDPLFKDFAETFRRV